MDALRALMAKAKAWYDNKTPIDKLVYSAALCGILYVVQLFF